MFSKEAVPVHLWAQFTCVPLPCIYAYSSLIDALGRFQGRVRDFEHFSSNEIGLILARARVHMPKFNMFRQPSLHGSIAWHSRFITNLDEATTHRKECADIINKLCRVQRGPTTAAFLRHRVTASHS